MKFNYLIIGGGVAEGAAVIRFRELDKENFFMILNNKPYHPCNRPLLTKDLWTSKKTVNNIFLKDKHFYEDNNIKISTNCLANKKAVVIGGSFKGSEIAASLNSKGIFTTMIFPGFICAIICYLPTLATVQWKPTRRPQKNA